MLEAAAPDAAAVVAVANVAKKRGWDKLAVEALARLERMIREASGDESLSTLLTVHAAAVENGALDAVALAETLLERRVEAAEAARDATQLLELLHATERRCASAAEAARLALRRLAEHWRERWGPGEKAAAEARLASLGDLARKLGHVDVAEHAAAAAQRARKLELARMEEVASSIRADASVAELATAAEAAAKWGWEDVAAGAAKELEGRLERAFAKGGAAPAEGWALAASVLAEISGADRVRVLAGASKIAKEALAEARDRAKGQQDPDTLVALVVAARTAGGGGEFAGSVRRSLRELVDAWAADAGKRSRIVGLRDAARREGEVSVADAADDALSVASARQEAARAACEAALEKLRSAKGLEAVAKVLWEASDAGWDDLVQEAQASLDRHVAEAEKRGAPGLGELVSAYGAAPVVKVRSAADAVRAALDRQIAEAQRQHDTARLLQLWCELEKVSGAKDLAKAPKKALLAIVAEWREQNSTLRPSAAGSLLEEARRRGKRELEKELSDIVSLRGRMDKAAKAARGGDRDVAPLLKVAEDAEAARCSALAREAVLVLKEGRRFGALRQLRASAQKAGMDALAEVALRSIGEELPEHWSLAKEAKGGKVDPSRAGLVYKVPARDPELVQRVQKLVNYTFRSFGRREVKKTMDRKAPMGAWLKVEEVVHIENAENYLNYSVRRSELAGKYKASSCVYIYYYYYYY